MPQNVDGTPIDADPYNLNDGFSPGQVITLRVPGLDTPEAFSKTDPIPLNDLSRNESEDSNEPIVVIDAESGKRVPIWVELDSNASTPASTALLIHPAKQFESGHRYIVAMRKLKDASGTKLAAPEGFRYYRDDLPSEDAAINDQRKRFDKVFRSLRSVEDQAQEPLPGLGLHRLERREHRPAPAAHPRRRVRPARRHQPRRRRGRRRRRRSSRSTRSRRTPIPRSPAGWSARSRSPAT